MESRDRRSVAQQRKSISGFLACPAWLFGTNPPTCSSNPMAKASKNGRAVIPEPSFGFFLRAMGAMLLLVIIMTAYFSLRA
jgi:hypothetical protein